MLAYLAAHLAGELVVDGMARAGGDDASLDGTADKGHVAYDVQKLVAGGFVAPHKRAVVEVTELCRIAVLDMQMVGKAVECLLRYLSLVYHYGIVEVAALYESGFKQRLYLAHEDKGAGGGYLLAEMLHVVKRGELAVDKLRVKGYHRRYRELVVGEDDDGRAGFLVAELYLLLYDVEVFRRILRHDAYAAYVFYVYLRASVQYRQLRTVYLQEAVVYAQSVERGHGMLDGAAACIALRHHGSARGVNDVLRDSLYDGTSVKVYALYLVAVVFGGGVESDGKAKACVKTFPEKRKAAAECLLFRHI